MYRLLPHFQVALVRNQSGGVDYHYQSPAHNTKGPLIPWLSPADRERFLAEGIVEEIPDQVPAEADSPAEPIAGTAVNGELVAECVAKLDEIRDETGRPVPNSAGRPTCEKTLRAAGFAFSNEVISAAVKQRKCRIDEETNEEKQGAQ